MAWVNPRSSWNQRSHSIYWFWIERKLRDNYREHVREVKVQILHWVTTELYQQHSFQPITACHYPMVNSSGMVEVMASDKVILPQSNIVDVVFILPVFKVEQGTFYMSSSKLIYFKRYCVTGNSIIWPCHPNLYFRKFYFEPFSVPLFHSLKNLAQNLTRSLHHGPSSRISWKLPYIFSG